MRLAVSRHPEKNLDVTFFRAFHVFRNDRKVDAVVTLRVELFGKHYECFNHLSNYKS